MSFTDLKRREIKKYILQKIAVDDPEIIHKTEDAFGISVTSVKRYLKEELEAAHIKADDGTLCGYRLAEVLKSVEIPLEGRVEEDEIYFSRIASFLQPEGAAARIWEYVCAEILNNAIEHSGGSRLTIKMCRNCLYSNVLIVDDGIGVFRSIQDAMRKQGWDNPGLADALVELYKGKYTSKPESHSGEGIFFSCKLADQFALFSDATVMRSGVQEPLEITTHRLLAYASRIQKIGTMVCLQLANDSARKIKDIFDLYADIDKGVIRTRIPVREACVTGNPVARSQARRICHRLEEFKEVVLDFSGAEMMGQGFADEMFRVYVKAHPEVTLTPVNMNADVMRMYRHIARKQNENQSSI